MTKYDFFHARWFWLLCTFLIVAPIYFVKTSAGFAFAPLLGFDDFAFKTSAGISLSIIGYALMLGAVRLSNTSKKPRHFNSVIIRVAMVLAAYMTVVLIYGFTNAIAYSAYHALFTLLNYLVLVTPILLFVLISLVHFKPGSCIRFFDGISINVAIVSVFLSALFAYYHLVLGANFGNSYAQLAEVAYGAKNIYPIILCIGISCSIILIFNTSSGKTFLFGWLTLVLQSTYLYQNWSRSAAITLGLALCIWGLFQLYRFPRFWAEKHRVVAVITTLGVIMAAGAFHGGLHNRVLLSQTKEGFYLEVLKKEREAREEAEATEKQSPVKNVDENTSPKEERQDTAAKEIIPDKQAEAIAPLDDNADQEQVSDERTERKYPSARPSDCNNTPVTIGTGRRTMLMTGAIYQIMERPIFGFAFRPVGPDCDLGGAIVGSHKVYPAHNQFLDIAARSGVLGLALYLSLLALIAYRLLLLVLKGSRTAEISLAMLIALSAGANFQSYFVVLQCALLIFAFLAFSLKAAYDEVSA